MSPTDGKPVVVFDLDGTILQVNSFPRWVLFLIMGRVPALSPWRRAKLSLHCLWCLLHRKLLRTGHDELVWRLQQAWRAACGTGAGLAGLEAALLRRVRRNLAAVLGLVAAGEIDAVLATGAAADYAVGVGRQLGFRHILATPADRARGEPGNLGTHKRRSLLALIAKQGWLGRPIILFTDHLDDLPLMRDSTLICWFGSPDSAARTEAALLPRRLVFCRDLDGDFTCAIVQRASIGGQDEPQAAIVAS